MQEVTNFRIVLCQCAYKEIFPAVFMGDDVWIGANVVIFPNISVWSHVIIGAGAIVPQSVPDFAVVGGNPAKVLKVRNRVQEDMLEGSG
jgi:acetyltransferase-like isoleucine patch superfamily enzyme